MLAYQDPEVQAVHEQVEAYNAELRLEKAMIPDPREAWRLRYHDRPEYNRRLYGSPVPPATAR